MPNMPISPTNVIYTGVAGTGKTYQLLQIAAQYTDQLPTYDADAILKQVLQPLSWREVICLIFLDLQQELVRVPELLAHDFFVAKAAHNARDKNLSNTAWSVLQMHSARDSQTVEYSKRASQAYFDKDESGAWYLLPESRELLTELAERLTELRQAQQVHQPLQRARYSMVSFHQAYGYEEFVEGIRPIVNDTSNNKQGGTEGTLRYGIQDGAFLQLCQRAAKDPAQRYAMLIDEINRANVSRVFGELFSLIEPDKRAGQSNAMHVQLAYSNRSFSVPANVDIYATMNTQDHSLAPLDMALRRRFAFIECPPRPELLPVLTVDGAVQGQAQETQEHGIDLGNILMGLNQRIVQILGSEAQLGHAFFMSIQSLAQLQRVLVTQVIPQLAQAANGQVAVLQYLFGDEQQPTEQQFVQDSHAQQRSTHGQPSFADQSSLLPQTAMLGQQMSGGYVINPDLRLGAGVFAQPAIYQRLY